MTPPVTQAHRFPSIGSLPAQKLPLVISRCRVAHMTSRSDRNVVYPAKDDSKYAPYKEAWHLLGVKIGDGMTSQPENAYAST